MLPQIVYHCFACSQVRGKEMVIPPGWAICHASLAHERRTRPTDDINDNKVYLNMPRLVRAAGSKRNEKPPGRTNER